MSKIEVDTIDTQSSTTLQVGSTNTSLIKIGTSGDTVEYPAGTTFTQSGTQNVTAGGAINVKSGGNITIDSGATITNNGTATGFSADLTNLNATNLSSGTVPDARFPATLPAISGANLTNLDLTGVNNDIATLALHQATNNNSSRYNLANTNVDVYQDSTAIANLINVSRDATGKYISSVIPTGFTVDTNNDLNTNLIAHYEWNNNDDDITSINPLTPEGTPTYSTSIKKLGTHSVFFSDSADAFAFTNGAPSWGSPSVISMATWIYWQGTDNGYNMIFDGYGTGSSSSFNFSVNDNGDKAETYDTSNNWGASTSTVSKNAWVHLGYVLTTSAKKFYINGSLINTVSGSFGLGTANAHNRIGARNNDTHGIKAYLDQTLFWNKEVSAQEMTDLYNGGSGNVYVVGSASATGSYQSTTQTANASVNKISAVVTYINASGTATLNTDLILEVSADNGATFTTATLAPIGTFSSGVLQAAANNITVTAGTQIKYKVSFANQATGTKVTQVNGVSLQY